MKIVQGFLGLGMGEDTVTLAEWQNFFWWEKSLDSSLLYRW
jgi:hypothetical protein